LSFVHALAGAKTVRNDAVTDTDSRAPAQPISTVVSFSTALVIFENARKQIAEAATADEVQKALALAIGLAAAARKATDKELEAEAAVLRFEAERRLGEMMAEQPKAGRQ
jgi:hypothetical protein